MLRTILDRDPEIQITDSMLMAARYSDQLQFLLFRCPDVHVSDRILGSAFDTSSALLQILFNHDSIVKIGEGPVRACLEKRDSTFLEYLLQQDPDLSIPSDTPSILIEQFRWFDESGPDVRSIIDVLTRHGKNVELSSDNRRYIDDLFQLQAESNLKQQFSLEKTP